MSRNFLPLNEYVLLGQEKKTGLGISSKETSFIVLAIGPNVKSVKTNDVVFLTQEAIKDYITNEIFFVNERFIIGKEVK